MINLLSTKEFQFQVNQFSLFGQFWQAQNAKAILLLVHGMGEHSGRYVIDFIPRFIQQNISVIALDQFGHGRTSGKRGVSPDYELHLQAIDELIKQSHHYLGDLPLIIYGHSMGGNVVANYLLTRHTGYTAGILSSPFLHLAFKPPRFKLFLAKIVNTVMPTFTQRADLEIDALSRDKNIINTLKQNSDPLMHNRASASFLLPFLTQGNWAIEHSYLLQKPTLLVHGTGDRITDFSSSQKFAQNNQQKVTFIPFKDGYHELHNDLCKDDLFKELFYFIDNVLESHKA